MQLLSFSSAEESAEWRNDLSAIKDRIAWINTKWYPEPRMSLYRDQWVPMVHAFEQKWGAALVPADVRTALAEVEAAVAEEASNTHSTEGQGQIR